MPGAAATPGRTYAGRTGHERADERHALLVDAAFAHVAEHGFKGLSIDALCRRAALNKRYFYEGFADLDALVAAVTTKTADDAIAVTLRALAGPGSTDERSRRAIQAFVVHLTDDPRRARVLFGAVPAGDAAAGHRTAAIRQVISTAAAQGREVHALDDAPIVGLSAAMLIGGTSQAVLDWLDGRVECTRDEFVDDLAALWRGITDTTVALAREQRAGR